MKFSPGDTVLIISGKDREKKGTVLRIYKDDNRIVVAGINMKKKHVKKTSEGPGRIVSFEGSISASNAMLLDPKTGKPTRIGYKVDANGKKVRVAKVSGTVIGRTKLDEKALKNEKIAAGVKAQGKATVAKDTTKSGKTATGPAASTVGFTRTGGRGS